MSQTTLKTNFFVESCYIQEDHQVSICGVSFFSYPLSIQTASIFATIGSNRASIYECLPAPFKKQRKGKNKSKNGTNDQLIELLQCYVDEAWDELFYCLCWAIDKSDQSPLLCVAGELGVIKVINCNNQTLKQVHCTLDMAICFVWYFIRARINFFIVIFVSCFVFLCLCLFKQKNKKNSRCKVMVVR